MWTHPSQRRTMWLRVSTRQVVVTHRASIRGSCRAAIRTPVVCHLLLLLRLLPGLHRHRCSKNAKQDHEQA
jgi:hypothetical protein